MVLSESKSHQKIGEWVRHPPATKTPTTIYSLALTYTPNGNVLTANDSVNGNWTYGYDAFNRLVRASATGQAYTYDYDRFGNRWHQNGPHASSVSFSGNNNRMDGFSYDAAGNLLNDGVHSYSYDAENRIVGHDTGGGPSFGDAYDADGLRTFHHDNGGYSEPLYDLEGHIFLDQPQGLTEIYAGGRHLATYNHGPYLPMYFNHVDWLGTERVRSTVAGASCETITSLPFGDAETITSSCSDWSPLHFTGKERDSETGLDYFGARYDSSQYGRFMIPDWAAKATAVPYAEFGDPQTLNLYAYVRNNPLSKADLDGHNWWDKFKNVFGDAACWCEGNQAAQSAARNNAEREGARRAWAGFMNTPEGRNYMMFGALYGGTMGAGDAFLNEGEESAMPMESEAKPAESVGIVAKNGTKVTGLTEHGVNRVIGDAWERAGTKPSAILDALKNPTKIVSGVDPQGRPFEQFIGRDAQVIVNPQTGKIVTVNPLSGAGAH